jgi:Cu2+-exporting ATPase
VLVRSDPRDVVAAIELSRATYTKMVQNLVWATGYNLVAIPVAMGIFVPGASTFRWPPGAIAMSLSTIVVAINDQLLRRTRLRRENPPGHTAASAGVVRKPLVTSRQGARRSACPRGILPTSCLHPR